VATLGCEALERGPLNVRNQQVDEHGTVAELERLSAVHLGILERLLPAA
jgi:hypothetical protein